MPARRICFAPLAIAAAASLFVTACDSGPAVADAPLYGSALTGDYSLSDTAGRPVSSSDFAGQYQLVYFGYTFCPNVCPFDVQRMMSGYEMFAEKHPELAAEVQPIFITVDPERDTPEKVAEYTNAFSDRLLGLVGTTEQLEAASKAFFFTFQRIDPIAEGGDYDIQHPSIGYLVDREGQPMAMIPVEQSPEAVAAELEKWVR